MCIPWLAVRVCGCGAIDRQEEAGGVQSSTAWLRHGHGRCDVGVTSESGQWSDRLVVCAGRKAVVKRATEYDAQGSVPTNHPT